MHYKWAQAAIYIGAGVGLVIFAFFGLLPGSFLGGAIGLNLAGKIFGTPLRTLARSQDYNRLLNDFWGCIVRNCYHVYICRARQYRGDLPGAYGGF